MFPRSCTDMVKTYTSITNHNACRVGNSASDEKNIITRYNIQGVWLGNVNGIANIIRKRSSLGSAGFDPAKNGCNGICTEL